MARKPYSSGDKLPLQLKSGAYTAGNIIANAQRCLNLYPEQNPQETAPEAPFTHYPTPGLTPLALFPDRTMVRGLYRTTQGDLYGACGGTLYWVKPDWTFQFVANIPKGTSQVKMADNGVTMVVVDGTSNGTEVNLATHNSAGITAAANSGPNGFGFKGANYVDYIDTFLIGNTPGTPDWFASISNEDHYDALSFASKSGSPDPCVAVQAVRRYVWVIGTLTTEIWYDAGNAIFPFAILDGPYIEHGCIATYSVAKIGEGLAWLSQDKRGKVVALLGEGYTAQRISTFAQEVEWSKYSNVDDAIGMSYMMNGHAFYILIFPTVGKTWTWDYMTHQWHERCTLDKNGNEARWRPNCMAYAYETVVVGDYQNGLLYKLDPAALTDNQVPIKRLRGFPHIVADLDRVRHTRLLVDMDCGNPVVTFSQGIQILGDPSGTPILGDPSGTPILGDNPLYAPGLGQLTPEVIINLRYSDTRGHTWNSPRQVSLGSGGQYNRTAQMRRLGMGRDRVYELWWSTPAVSALNGLYLEADVAGS